MPPSSLIWPQRWKLYVGFAGFALGGIAMFLDAQVATALSLSRYIPTVLGTLIGIVAFAWLFLTLRCAQCGLRLFWHAVSSKTMGGWLSWLLAVEKCPRCGT